MPAWLRNLVMIAVLGMTIAFGAIGLIRHQSPPWELLGIPATTFVALSATKVKITKQGVEVEKEQPEDDTRTK